jgi:hypothetical protein
MLFRLQLDPRLKSRSFLSIHSAYNFASLQDTVLAAVSGFSLLSPLFQASKQEVFAYRAL